jgi:hypothetical protein
LLTLKNHVLYITIRTESAVCKKNISIILTASILVLILLTSAFVSTVFVHNAIYAQSSNAGFGNTTNLSLPNGKSIPITT